jgi:sugar-specific transcriptional regulator TrmB
MALSFLKSIGLTDKETVLYELLITQGELPISTLLKKTNLKRATVYKSLYSLEKKGLIIKKTIAKKIHFRPTSPTNLLSIAEEQFRALERAKDDLQTIMPELTSSYIVSVEKPVVTQFEGIDGLKKIYEDTLQEGKPIYAALTTEKIEPTLFRWITNVYIKKRIEKKIPVKVIISSGGWADTYVKKSEKELRETRLVSAKAFPFAHEMDIYGDKVAFIDFREGKTLIGIIIHHPAIAQTMKALWSLAWGGALAD